MTELMTEPMSERASVTAERRKLDSASGPEPQERERENCGFSRSERLGGHVWSRNGIKEYEGNVEIVIIEAENKRGFQFQNGTETLDSRN